MITPGSHEVTHDYDLAVMSRLTMMMTVTMTMRPLIADDCQA